MDGTLSFFLLVFIIKKKRPDLNFYAKGEFSVGYTRLKHCVPKCP